MSEDDLHPGLPPVDDEAIDGSRLLPVPLVRPDACPRDARHEVSLRADGAIWCRACDEGFYPLAVIWGAVAPSASV